MEQFMVGESPAMTHIFEMIRRFARADAPVLIVGESGTGKELAARAIHERSSRASQPFVAINCAALPATLIASELFGYEKGAFTGATARKIGQIEAANGGTLFLDEIGDLPIELQGHLLRFLAEHKIVRVGGNHAIAVDVRIISATNVQLPVAITESRFREDLYYRLNVLNMRMPPLRERGADLELLATFFLRRVAQEFGRQVDGFHPDTLTVIRNHRWPGNVREMIAAIRRAVVMGSTSYVLPGDLGLEVLTPASRPQGPSIVMAPFSRPRPRSAAECQAIVAALQQCGDNVTHAARLLGVSRITLYRMLRRNHLLDDRLNGHEHADHDGFATPPVSLRDNVVLLASPGVSE